MNEKQEQEQPLVGQLAEAAVEILLQGDAEADVDPQEILKVASDFVVIEFEKRVGRYPGPEEADRRLVIPATVAATHAYLLRQAKNGVGLLYTFGYTNVNIS